MGIPQLCPLGPGTTQGQAGTEQGQAGTKHEQVGTQQEQVGTKPGLVEKIDTILDNKKHQGLNRNSSG